MKKLRTSMIALATLAVLGTNMVTASAHDKALSVEVNGKKMESAAILDQGKQKVLVPLREVAESLGFQVTWNATVKAAEVRKGEIMGQVKLSGASNPGDFQDQMYRPEGRLHNGSTYVEIDFVSEVMQAQVHVTDHVITVMEESEIAPAKIGTITTINKNDKGQISILLNGYETGIILHLTEQTKITSADGKTLKPEDLKLGMEIEATHPNFMALSMPPQAGAITIVVKSSLESKEVLGTVGRVVSVEKEQSGDGATRITVEGDPLTKESQPQVALVITEDTIIVNARDQKRMKPEEIKPEMKVYAFYGPVMTKSLPPQVGAEKIVVEIVEENE